MQYFTKKFSYAIKSSTFRVLLKYLVMQNVRFRKTKRVLRNTSSLYFIAIVPPEQIKRELIAVQRYMAENYQTKGALTSMPHLTLQLPISLPEWGEAALLRKLQAFSSQLKPFDITLDGFDHFRDQVIYARLKEDKAIKELQKNLMAFLREELSFPKDKTKTIDTPHIPVGKKDLKPEIFPQAWNDLAARPYKRTFTVRKICLLKHNYRQWEVLEDLPFSPDLFAMQAA